MLAGKRQVILICSGVTGSYQFIHALIRETIYEDMPAIDRARLHARVGDALANLYCAHIERALSRIAYHYYEATALGNFEKAVAFALRAAESAVRMFAYEEALVHYDRAIQTLESSGATHDERLVRAYILKGSALYQMVDKASLEVLLEAVNRACALGNTGVGLRSWRKYARRLRNIRMFTPRPRTASCKQRLA